MMRPILYFHDFDSSDNNKPGTCLAYVFSECRTMLTVSVVYSCPGEQYNKKALESKSKSNLFDFFFNGWHDSVFIVNAKEFNKEMKKRSSDYAYGCTNDFGSVHKLEYWHVEAIKALFPEKFK